MSDGTKSGYTKTGKKVKCISSGRIDLIYKKVYDVFIDVNGDEFVIDEAGDWSYDSMEFPLWCEVFDDVNTENKTTKSESVVVRKFKVGDLVRVTSTDYISQFDKSIEVGDIGTITSVSNSYDKTNYCVNLNETSGKIYWWFTESDLELVEG